MGHDRSRRAVGERYTGFPLTSSRGRLGEGLAERALRDCGLRLLERNYRCRWGEIDLVMLDGTCTVFVEVRLRGRRSFVSALESIGQAKRGRLIKTGEHYLMTHPEACDRPARFDVVAISDRGEDNDLRWLKDAFRP